MSQAPVFDRSFDSFSYRDDMSHQMQAIEVVLEHDGDTYVMTVETHNRRMARLEIDGVDAEDDGDAQTFMITADEILPQDLEAIKQMPFESLKPYLLKQEKI